MLSNTINANSLIAWVIQNKDLVVWITALSSLLGWIYSQISNRHNLVLTEFTSIQDKYRGFRAEICNTGKVAAIIYPKIHIRGLQFFLVPYGNWHGEYRKSDQPRNNISIQPGESYSLKIYVPTYEYVNIEYLHNLQLSLKPINGSLIKFRFDRRGSMRGISAARCAIVQLFGSIRYYFLLKKDKLVGSRRLTVYQLGWNARLEELVHTYHHAKSKANKNKAWWQ